MDRAKEGYSSVELTRYIKYHTCTYPIFGGVVSANKIPTIEKYPTFYIVNTSNIPSVVGHWILLFFPAPDYPIEYYDSLCNKPSHYSYEIEAYLQMNSNPKYHMNKSRHQPSSSYNCGLYCAFVADKRSRGYDFNNVMKYFDKVNLWGNDEMVEDYYINHIQKQKFTIKNDSRYKLNQFTM